MFLRLFHFEVQPSPDGGHQASKARGSTLNTYKSVSPRTTLKPERAPKPEEDPEPVEAQPKPKAKAKAKARGTPRPVKEEPAEKPTKRRRKTNA